MNLVIVLFGGGGGCGCGLLNEERGRRGESEERVGGRGGEWCFGFGLLSQ